MKWAFNKILFKKRSAFTMIEVATAIIILAMIAATTLVIINRAIDTVVLWQTRMQAFEIARENMEKILTNSAVSDFVEYGTSTENPDIAWQTVVESFYEPITSNMWIRAVCSAEFTDSDGQRQKIELTHWLTGLTQDQVLQILEQKQRAEEYYRQISEQTDLQPQEQQDSQPEDEQLQQQQIDEEYWQAMEEVMGPPPEGYSSWSQVPQELFWQVVMKKLSENK